MITFPDNEIGDLGAEAFAQLIEKNTSIREITLSCTLHLLTKMENKKTHFESFHRQQNWWWWDYGTESGSDGQHHTGMSQPEWFAIIKQ